MWQVCGQWPIEAFMLAAAHEMVALLCLHLFDHFGGLLQLNYPTLLRRNGASRSCRFCSLIPGFGVKLSTTVLAGPTVLSAVGDVPSA